MTSLDPMQHNQINLGFSIAPVINALRVPAMALSLDGRVSAVNTRAVRLLGLADDQPQSKIAFKDFLNGAEQAEFDAYVQSLIAVEQDTERHFVLHWSGNLAAFVVSPLCDAAGTLWGVLAQHEPDAASEDFQAWRDAFLNGEHGLWEIDGVNGTCTFSDGWYEMRGRDRTDTSVLDFDTFHDRVHPDDLDGLQRGLRSVLQNEDDTYAIEFRERHKDGHFIWILSRGRVVARNAKGQPIRFIGTDTDISNLKASQNRIDDLTQKELRWQVAIESADQGVWDRDFRTDQSFVSTNWRRMRGIASDKDIAPYFESLTATLHPEDVDRINGELEKIDRGDTDVINYQYRQAHRDGHYIWILSRGRVVDRLPDGSPSRVIGTDTDITEIKQVEDEYASTSQRLTVAMRAADMGRWEYDLRKDVAYWDDRLLEMFGVADQDNYQAGDHWFKLIHPDDVERARAASKASVDNRTDLALDYRICRPNGEIAHVRTRAIFVADENRGDRFVGVNIDVTDDILRQEELEDARALLEHESRHDALTGLSNRRGIDELQSKYLKDVPNQRQAVLHFDLDNFKQINDTLGHLAGDAVLKHAATILSDATPKNGLAARVGGDEFVILLPDAPADTALMDMAKSIIAQMAQPFLFEGHPCNFGVSIGIAISQSDQTPDESLFVAADLALYAAKQEGRGRCRFFDVAMRKSAENRKHAFDALLFGFEKGEIICHYQPQFDAQSLQLTGLEALVRWDSPAHGIMTPDAFLGTAEEMGMIAEFDAMVMKRALCDLQKWEAKGLNIPRLSVNVSAARLSDPDLAQELGAMDIPIGKFAFELLESAYLDSFGDELAQNLRAIRDLGIGVEIDDFGTGHASIVSMLQVAPDRLKIDRQLIAPITHSKRQRQLVKTIINIGQMQGVAVVAEGVETIEHADILKSLGCDDLQGYALGRPLSFDDTTVLLRRLNANKGHLIISA